MKIAFYAPLKSPNHPVPSGDRLMARLIIRALTMLGHHVEVISELRSFMSAGSEADFIAMQEKAETEVDRLSGEWNTGGKPDLWFCYHPYYKAPDLIGPALCARFGLAYVTAEASYSSRRNTGGWTFSQDYLLKGIEAAAVNICFTRRDHAGLLAAAPNARFSVIPPFIDSDAFLRQVPAPSPAQLVTVAMMRSGDKTSSYKALAEGLSLISHLPWTLSVVGDGPARPEIEGAFASFEAGRINWLGERDQEEIAALLSQSAIYVWPGHGEAYGLAYLEAQACGLPVIAEAVAGVPEVVMDGRTGILTPPGDPKAYAAAIERLLGNDGERTIMARQARKFVSSERSMPQAAQAFRQLLEKIAETIA